MHVLLVTAAAVLLLAAPACAGTVGGAAGCDRECLANVGFRASPGEANRLSIRIDATQAIVRDDGAPLTAGSGCRPLSANEAACAFASGERYNRLGAIALGDGDDTLDLDARDWTLTVELGEGDDRFAGGSAIVDGGPGADVLTSTARGADLRGGGGDDSLAGGDGPDVLIGGEGSDELTGGGGDDVLEPGDDAPDRLDGGPGRDRLSYRTGTAPVVVDLADAAPEGAPGEGDQVAGVEDVEGTSGPDRLAGDDGPNRLYGGAGADALTGRGGDDLLVPGAGRTSAVCGGGDDTVRLTDGAQIRFGVTCERPLLRVGSGEGRVRFRPGGVLEVPCPAGTARRGPPCAVRATVTGVRAVERRATVRRGTAARLRFPRPWRCRVLIDLRIDDPGRTPLRTSLVVTPPGGARC